MLDSLMSIHIGEDDFTCVHTQVMQPPGSVTAAGFFSVL